MIDAPPVGAPGHFIMETARIGAVLKVVISGDLGRESAHHLEEIITHLTCPLDQVLIDLNDVSSIDPEGVDALIRSSDAIDDRGAHVVLEGVSSEALLLLEASGAVGRFDHVEGDVTAAFAHDRDGSS